MSSSARRGGPALWPGSGEAGRPRGPAWRQPQPYQNETAPVSHRSLVHQAGTHPRLGAQGCSGVVLFCLGFQDQALAQNSAAIVEAQRLGHPPSLAVSLTLGTVLLSLVGKNAALGELADQLIALATEQGFPLWRAWGTIYHGWVKAKNGDVAQGISLLRSGSTAYRATGAEAWMTHNIALLAGACEIAGQVEEAVTLLDEALQIAGRTGERWREAELNRHKGQLAPGRCPGLCDRIPRQSRNALAATSTRPNSGNCVQP
jgi:hypothetical protein